MIIEYACMYARSHGQLFFSFFFFSVFVPLTVTPGNLFYSNQHGHISAGSRRIDESARDKRASEWGAKPGDGEKATRASAGGGLKVFWL